MPYEPPLMRFSQRSALRNVMSRVRPDTAAHKAAARAFFGIDATEPAYMYSNGGQLLSAIPYDMPAAARALYIANGRRSAAASGGRLQQRDGRIVSVQLSVPGFFGNNVAGSDAFPCSNDRALIDRFALSQAANLSAVVQRFDASSTAGTSIKGLVLADNAGVPAAVLAVGAGVAVPAGGGWISSALSLYLPPGNYWLGYVANGFNCSSDQNDATGVAPDIAMANGTFNYASPPATWPGTDGNYGAMLCAYANYMTA